MATLTHLRSLQALELALRKGSLKDAATTLAITPAAVGQRIKLLEDYLGTELVMRGRSGLKAAPALAAVLSQLAGAFRDLENVATLLDMQRGHEMHIAAPSDFVELWLKPRLPGFARTYPNMRFNINGEGAAPLRIAPMDCEIRFAAARESGAVDVLFHDFVLPVASTGISKRLSAVPRRQRLEGFPLLHLDFYKDDPAAPGWPEWIRTQKLQRTEPNRGIRYQRIGTVIEAVLAHAGLTLCGMALIAPLLEDHSLLLPFPVTTGTWTEHAFIARFRADAIARPQVRRFREWLENEAAATRQWLTRKATGKSRAQR